MEMGDGDGVGWGGVVDSRLSVFGGFSSVGVRWILVCRCSAIGVRFSVFRFSGVGCMLPVVSGQVTVVSGQWWVLDCLCSVDSRLSVFGDRCSVVGYRLSVVSGQMTVVSGQ